MTQLASRIRRGLGASPLLPVAFVIWRTMKGWSPDLALRNRRARREADLPVPPGSLIFSATGTRDVSWFLRTGVMTVSALRGALGDLHRPIESFRAVLDLGCGCGRVLRHWSNVLGPKFFGTDYNPAGATWVATNLNYVSVITNDIAPPLRFENSAFDLVYAISVFTHLPVELQRPWIEELYRVIEPRGILLLTLSGEGDFERITEAERQQFREGNLVVVDPQFAGTNMCGAYHPRAYVEEAWGDLFKLLRTYPQGAHGSPKQDLYVFERQ